MNGEIKLFDKDFNPIGILDRYESLIVHKKMFEAGNFELHTPIVSIARMPEYLYCAALDAFCMVEHGSSANRVIDGTLLKGILDRKVITEDAVFTDMTAEQIAYTLAAKYAPIPMRFAAPSMQLQKVTASVEWGEPVGESISKILKAHELYYDITFDFAQMLPVFTVHAVTDPENAMPLSFAYQTIHDFDYAFDRSDAKNFAYVRGEFGDAAVELTVDLRADEGEELREVAFDLSGEVDAADLTAEQYEDALRVKAIEKLKEYPMVQNIVFTPAIDMKLGERRRFADDSLGIASEQVVTQTVQAIENGCIKRSYVFGLQKLTPYRRAVRDARRK